MHYIEILNLKYPNNIVIHAGNGITYDELQWSEFCEPISKEQLDQDIIEHYNSDGLLRLNNGIPAYLYLPYNNLVSIDSLAIIFSIKTTGSKNFWLNSGNIDGSTGGYYISNNSLIRKISISSKSIIPAGAIIKIKEPSGNTDYLSVTIPQATKNHSLTNIAAVIPSDIQLSCYVSSNANIADILVIIDVVQRN